jgi:hypothetical protein
VSLLALSACSDGDTLSRAEDVRRPVADPPTVAAEGAAVSRSDVLVVAADRTLAVTRGRFEYRQRIATDAIDLGAEKVGAFDRERDISTVTYRFVGLPDDFDATAESLGAIGATYTVPTELIATAEVTYARGGATATLRHEDPSLPAELDSWVRVDNAVMGDGWYSMSPVPFDPDAVLRAIAEAVDVTSVGAEEIRGIPTIRHHGKISTAAYRTALGASQIPGSRDVLLYDLDVWIDGDGLVRRVDFQLDMLAMMSALADTLGTPMPNIEDQTAFADGMGTSVETIEYYDLDADITIAVPTDARDVTEVVKRLGGG